MNLTNKQKEILLNLILSEKEQISTLNANIAPLIKDYFNELVSIYQEINKSIK